MRHLYECPVRWVDLDLLGHVNNVTYVDYLQEARIDMLLTHAPDSRATDLAEGVVVVRSQVQYVSPLTFRTAPVKIESWVSEIRASTFTMAYEVFDQTDEGRVVYARATTVLTPYVFAQERPRRVNADEREALSRFLGEDPLPGATEYDDSRHHDIGRSPMRVRFSDVDVYAHVNNVKYFEFFQEARIGYMTRVWESIEQDRLQDGGSRGDVPMVLARMDVDYRIPILFRPEPYDIYSWVSKLGNSSFVIDAEIVDEGRVLSRARVVMVTFDPATQRAAPAPEAYRDVLRQEIARAD
ncbi:MAG: thioesterase family protein [Nocardioides sp.]|nr:thioesterase family protein [Nocardioides sp.]